MPRPWILASRNAGKLRELRALFATHGIGAIDLREAGVEEDVSAEEAIEAFETFEENALAKARYFASRLPGRVVIADDSGLAVDALDGAPGVRSKRWSGRSELEGEALDASNNALLLSMLTAVRDRSARFVCAAAWCDGTDELVMRGEVVGRIVAAPQGEHGFGYDPHVFVDDLGRTMAEATVAEKERVSHRGRAFASLLAALRERGLVQRV
ncbi:MAG: RdgB/HAM1 family non-canonical purine NTP pyrophosphatase [bacterium]